MAAADSPHDVAGLIQDGFLKCTICFEIYTDPKTLPCLHSFCGHCLAEWTGDNTEEVTCPICRQSYNLGINGVKQLKQNFFLASLSECLDRIKCGSLKGSDVCSECDSRLATILCQDCAVRFCTDCTEKHMKQGESKSHQLLPLIRREGRSQSETNSQLSTTRCSRHPENEIQSYCVTCDLPVCTKCLLVEHRKQGHRIDSLDDVTRHKKHALRQSIQGMDMKTKDLNKAISTLQLESEKIPMSIEDADKTVDDQANKMIEHILEMKAKAKEGIRQVAAQKRKLLNNQLAELQQTEAMVNSALSFANTLLTYATPAEYLVSEKAVASRILHLQVSDINSIPSECGDFEFEPDNASLVHRFGRVRETAATGDNSSITHVKSVMRVGEAHKVVISTRDRENRNVTGYNSVKAELIGPTGKTQVLDIADSLNGSHTSIVNFQAEGRYVLRVFIGGEPLDNSPFSIKVIPRKGTIKTIGQLGCDKPMNPDGVALNHKNRLVIADKSNSRLLVVDSGGHDGPSIAFPSQFPKQFAPADIAVSHDGRYFATDPTNKQVVVCNEMNELIRTFGQGELSNPEGITLTRDERSVLVSDWKTLRKHCVKKFTTEGNLEEIFDAKGIPNGSAWLNHPSSVRVDSKNRMIIADTNNHRVVILDKSGNYLTQFGSKGSNVNQFVNPRGIDVDDTDNIYVCDSGNKRLSQHDMHGKFIQHVDCGEMCSPVRVAVSKYGPGRIAVTVIHEDNHRTVKVLYV